MNSPQEDAAPTVCSERLPNIKLSDLIQKKQNFAAAFDFLVLWFMKWASNRNIHMRLSQSWTLQEHFNDVHQLQCGSDEPGRAETWFLIMPWSIETTFCPAVAVVYTLHDWCTATGGSRITGSHTRDVTLWWCCPRGQNCLCADFQQGRKEYVQEETREQGLFSGRKVRVPAWIVVQQELHRSATKN